MSWPLQLPALLHVLTRTFLPPPQVLEHGLHSAHVDQEFVTSVNTEKKRLKCCVVIQGNIMQDSTWQNEEFITSETGKNCWQASEDKLTT